MRYAKRFNEIRYKSDKFFEVFTDLDFNDLYNKTVERFYEDNVLTELYLDEDGFSEGSMSIEDLIELKDNINEKHGEVVCFELDVENEGEYLTDLFHFLDDEFLDLFSDAIEQLKIYKRDWVFKCLKDLYLNADKGEYASYFSNYYYIINDLTEYVEEAKLDENSADFESDLDTTIANFIDYDSNYSNIF